MLARGPRVEGQVGKFRDAWIAPDGCNGARISLEVKWPGGGTVTWTRASLRETEPPSPRKAKVGTVYLRPRNSTPARNLELWCEQIDAAGKAGLDIVCLSEAILTVGTGRSARDVAETIPGPSTKRLGEAARRNRLWIVAGLNERDGDQLYNTAVLIDRRGELAGTYRKIHLPREEWRQGVTPGDEYPVFETDFGTVAIQICYDYFFPEAVEMFALRGAEIVFAPTWGTTFKDQDGKAEGRTVFRVRARDSGVYLVPSVYDGDSLVIDPLGRVLASSDGETGVFSAEIDLSEREPLWWVGHWRSIGPRHRMPETYREPPTIPTPSETPRSLNVLLLTADDLHCESVGAFGGKVPDLTPYLDRLASEGMRFFRAHVNVSICQPSRGVLGTGRYGHRSGILGFMHTSREIPTIMETLREAGYRTGVLGKVGHSTPKADYRWDFVHDRRELGAGRDPKKYYDYSREFFAECRKERKPFYFMVNSHDPHRPFHVPGRPIAGAVEPSKVYGPDDVPVPGFVPDLPGVRQELSHYLNSVRRCDDTFGKVLQALDEAGYGDTTVVMFLSDNGIAIPFAKCNAYLASTRTPWIVRWPGVTKPGAVDRTHFISGIDFYPTILDALGVKTPEGLDGSSFVPLLRGGTQSGRDRVFTQIDQKAGGDAVPMRCVQTARFGYIFNPWSDGTHYYRNNNEGLTMRAMNEAAATDPSIAERVRMFRYRALEELYDLERDPDCLRNLIEDEPYREEAERLRDELRDWMRRTEDPLLPAFEKRDSPGAVQETLETFYGERATRLQKPRKKG
jgi:N-sulfoglucosamine sulfohydrolase